MTHFGYIKRLPVSEYKAQHRGGAGITAHKPKEEDFVENMFVTCTHDDLMFFTNKGKVYRIKAYFVPEAERTARGRAIVNLLQLLPDERVTAVIPIKEGSDMDGCLIMATRQGLIKKTPLSEFESIRKVGKIAIVLREGDELISVSRVSEGDDVMLASAFGKCIRFNESDVRSMGRTSSGVRSIKTDGEDDYVVDMAVIEKDSVKDVLTVTELGYGKRCPITEYRVQSRAGKGSKAGKFSDETGRIVNLKLVDPGDDVMLIANTGIIIRMPASEISRISRSTKGVRIMRLKEDGRVVCVAVAAHEEEVEAEAEKTPDLAENPAPESVAIPGQTGEENETPKEGETVNPDSPDEVE